MTDKIVTLPVIRIERQPEDTPMTDSTEADIVERLSRSLKPFWSYTQKDVIGDAMAEITQLRAERDAAARALKPFADAAGDLDESARYGDHIWESPAAMNITAGDLHEACNVLSLLPNTPTVIATEEQANDPTDSPSDR